MAAEKKRKLNYRFHDPNPPEVAAGYILRILIEANTGKAESTIRLAGERQTANREQEDGSA